MVRRLAEGVWWIRLSQSNAYLVADDGYTLVDAGTPGDADRLVDAVREVAGGLDAIDRVLVTHFDMDHVGGLGRLPALDAPVYAGERDAPLVAGETKPGWTDRKALFHRLAGWWCDPPSGPVEAVADGETVAGFGAHHTPGHTAGHVVFVHEGRSVAFLGDLVHTDDGSFGLPPWYFSRRPGRVRTSLREFVETAPPFDVAAAGHGRPLTAGGSDRLRDYVGSLD